MIFRGHLLNVILVSARKNSLNIQQAGTPQANHVCVTVNVVLVERL